MIIKKDLKVFELYLKDNFDFLSIEVHRDYKTTVPIMHTNGTEYFMYPDGNRIFDALTKRAIYKLPYSPTQIIEALHNADVPLETMRESSLKDIIKNLNTKIDYNIIISNEGLGKSSLIPKFKEKYNRDRIVVVFKSYNQILNRKITLTNNSPELSSEVVPSTERLLQRYHVEERVFIKNKETGDLVLSFRKSVEASSLEPAVKYEAIQKKSYYDDIIEDTIHKDIIFLTEDKLNHEIVFKKHFRTDLVVFDEFNQDTWFEKRMPTEQELKRRKNKPKLFMQETWSDRFKVRLGVIPLMWYNFIDKDSAKFIVLSTEQKVVEFFQENPNFECNIIDERLMMLASENCQYNIIKHALMTQKNKNKLATALRMNDYIVVGNGVNSTINNVSALGQNYHEEWKGKKIAILITQPAPEEIAPLMANLNLDHDAATLIKMIDTANQLIGRAQGFRDNVGIEDMQVFFPDKFAYEILPFLRYFAFIRNSYTNKNDLMEKIIHSLNVIIQRHKAKPGVYLKSLKDKINETCTMILENGINIVDKYSSFKFFKFSKILRLKSRKEHLRYSILNSARKIKASYTSYGDVNVTTSDVYLHQQMSETMLKYYFI